MRRWIRCLHWLQRCCRIMRHIVEVEQYVEQHGVMSLLLLPLYFLPPFFRNWMSSPYNYKHYTGENRWYFDWYWTSQDVFRTSVAMCVCVGVCVLFSFTWQLKDVKRLLSLCEWILSKDFLPKMARTKEDAEKEKKRRKRKMKTFMLHNMMLVDVELMLSLCWFYVGLYRDQ